MASTRFKLAVFSGALLGFAGVASFGPIVRNRAEAAAERLGATITVDSVVPAWGGARLRGVHLRLAEVPSATVDVGEVSVKYGFAGRSVRVDGVLVSAVGSREMLTQQIEAWRSHRSQAPEPSNGGAKASGELDVEGLAFSWKDDEVNPHEAVTAHDVKIDRSRESLSIEAGDATVQLGYAGVVVKGARIGLEKKDGRYRLISLSAGNVDATVELAPPAEKSAEPPADAKKAKLEGDALQARGSKVREAILRVAVLADGSLDPALEIALHGVRVRVKRGDDTVGLGPGALALTRANGRIQVELSQEAGRETPEEHSLTFRASAPLQDPKGDVVIDVQGGPIGLATLGVAEGDLGLFDVAHASLTTRAHLVLAADQTVSIDGEGKLHAVSLRSAAISDEPVSGLDLAWKAKATASLDGSRVTVDQGEIDIGAVQVTGAGTFERDRDGFRVRGHLELPLTGCQAMLDAAPRGLLAKVQGMRLAGSFGLKGRADFDTAHLDSRYLMDWETTSSCRVLEAPPSVAIERFQKAFKHTVYTPEGRPTEIETGPGTAGWTSFSGISRFMPVALQTTEDGGFSRHHGFDHEAIKNSIRENLRKKKFVRGASTLSMQLAKNVYLDRTKNLARKLQEAILTMYLEQALTKDQILELYLNVVEFGPMVYGIGPAARHYFNASAAELSLGQSLYLSSLLPNPKVQHFGAGGAATPGWTSYLQKLMKNARKRDWISEDELKLGLRETVVRGSPTPLLSPQPLDGVADEPPEMFTAP